jgi:hypothetical protein
MATQKFTDLTATTTPNTESVFAIAYSGSNFKLTITDLASNLPAVTATSLTSSGTLTTSGNATIGGDLTITGDDLTMGTNTSGAALIADGTNFNPVVISGDISIGTTGTAAIGTGVIVNADVNASAALAFSKMENLTASRALVSDGSGDVSVSAVTSTEVGYLDGVTSAIQTQLDAKASSSYVPTAITVADESSDTTCFPLFTTAATGDLGPKTASGLTFNSSTDVLSGTFAGNITGNVTGNVSGTSGSTTGNAATATALATARNIGGVSFNGTANIDLPGVNSAGNQNTSGTAATATTSTNVTVADESSDTTCFPLFVTAATGDLPPKSGSNLAFNSSSGVLTATGFAGDLTGDVTGNASGSSGSCTGNSATATTSTNVTVADESSDTTCFPLFVTAATGDLAPKSGSNLAFNSSSGVLTATGFAGALTGNVTGNVSGSSGSCTGNSATATSAATLTTARNIGGVSFNGSANIDLPGVNAAGSQNTSGTAAGLSSTLVVGSGGTGATSLTANGVIIGNGTSALTAVDLSTKGKILIGDGSGNPQALAVGTNNYVLTADSSEATGVKWAEASGGGGGLAVISAVNEYNASGNTTSYSFTGFDSSYDNYYVIIHGISQQGAGDIQMRFLDDGSAITGSNYRQTTLGLTHNNSEKRITTDAADKFTLVEQQNSGDKDPMNGFMYFNNPAGGRWDSDSNDSKGQISPSFVYQIGGEGSNGTSRIAQGHGYINDTQANTCNGFQLIFAGGTGASKINMTIYGVVRA